MKEINHEYYVSLEVAKLLKEAGFDWRCSGIYVLDSENDPEYVFSTANFTNTSKEIEGYIRLSAPTLDVAQRWLREVKGMILNITFDARTNKNHSYSYDGVWYKNGFVIQYFGMVTNYVDGYPHGFETYEQALESCIQKCLTILLKEK